MNSQMTRYGVIGFWFDVSVGHPFVKPLLTHGRYLFRNGTVATLTATQNVFARVR